MAGLNDTDIKLDSSWQLTPAANGDSPLVPGLDCLFQDIQLEALTQEGELFYDEIWGWSLLDFIQTQYDDIVRLEIQQRVKNKLKNRSEIDTETIETQLAFESDKVSIKVSFKFVNDTQTYQLDLELDRVKVEVILV